jgi:hypothetical protein
MKTALQLINQIAKCNYEAIIIGGNDEMTPMQAIYFLSRNNYNDSFDYSDTIKKGQLHIW